MLRYKPRSTNLSHNSETLKAVLLFYEAIQINKNENKKTCTDVKDAPLNIYKKILRHMASTLEYAWRYFTSIHFVGGFLCQAFMHIIVSALYSPMWLHRLKYSINVYAHKYF